MTYVGTAVMPASAAKARCCLDLGAALVGVEEVAHVVGVEAGGDRLGDEHVGVADVQAPREVGRQQALLEVVLGAGRPVVLGVPEQAVGVAGVGPLGLSRWNSRPSAAATSVRWSMIAAARSGPPNLRAYMSGTGIAVPGGAFGSSW